MKTDEGIELYVRILRKRLTLMVSLWGLAVVTTGIVTLCFTPRTYKAQTSLLFSSPAPSGALPSLLGREVPTLLSGFAGLGGSVDTYIDILKSRTLAERVVTRLGLMETYGVESMDEAVRELSDSRSVEKTRTGLVVIEVKLAGTPRVRQGRDLWSSGEANQRDQSTRQMVAQIAQAYVEELRQYVEESAIDRARRYRQFIEKRFQEVQQQLEAAEQALDAFRQKEKVVEPSEEIQGLLQTRAQLEADKLRAEGELQGLVARLGEITRQLKEQAKAPLALPLSNPLIEEWRKDLVELKAQLALDSEKYGPENPEILTLKSQIRRKEEQINDEVKRLLQAVDSRFAPQLAEWEAQRLASDAKVKGLNQALGQLESRLAHLPSKMTNIGRLMRQQKMLETLYTTLATELETARNAEQREATEFQVLDPAIPPRKKSQPRTFLNLAVSGALALFVGFFLAFSLEYLERKERPLPDA